MCPLTDPAAPLSSPLPPFSADTQQLGVLSQSSGTSLSTYHRLTPAVLAAGDLAVPFFARSDLPPLLLGEVWQIADPDNNGFLSPDRFGVACRLIGHAQQHKRTGAPQVKPEWVSKREPHPTSPCTGSVPRSTR